jgi:D-psicose/D-tagatose/L-ribulose 3-epimerase
MTENPLGIHALVWTGSWGESQARDAIVRTKTAGYDLLEIGCLDSWKVDTESTHTLLQEYELGVVGSLGLGVSTDISSGDPERVAAGEACLANGLRIVRDLGGSILTGITYSRLGKYDHPPTADARSSSVEAMQRAADRANDMGLSIGVEVVNRYDSNLINTAHQAIAYLDAVDRTNLLIHLDTYHMNMEETDLASAVGVCGDRLGYVHVSESHRGYLSSGTVDFSTFFKSLVQAKYSGPLTFESFSSTVVDPTLSNLLGIWREVWTDNDHLAMHAQRFMSDSLTAARAHLATLVP